MKKYFQILRYGGENRLNFILSYIFYFFYNIFGAISLTMVIPFLDILFASKIPEKPSVEFTWTDTAVLKEYGFYQLGLAIENYGHQQVLIYFCIVLASSIIAKNIFRYLSIYNIIPFEQAVIRKLRQNIFGKLTELPIRFYTTKKKGDIINIVVSDVQVIQDSVIGTVKSIISDPITMLVFLFSMLFISWKLTLFTLIVLPLTGYFISIIAKTLKQKAHKSQEMLGKLIAVLDEYIGGLRIVKAFNGDTYEKQKYSNYNKAYYKYQVSLTRRSDMASPVTEVLSVFVVIFIIIYGGMMILSEDKGAMKASEFIGFIALFSQFLAPIKTFASAISRIQKGIASYARVETILDEPSSEEYQQNLKVKEKFTQNIEFQDVVFRYEEKEILKKVNLEIPKGKMLAIVGPSGAGKSTLVDLIPRFYELNSGEIKIDNENITSIDVRSLRNMMGIVTQEGVLFNDTVFKNIAYGSNSATHEQVRKAAEIANAWEFIEKLPEGLDTMIGERGAKLSGGQRQRIAIARAVLKNPPILILDEATSALDTESEKLVQEALEKLMENRTSIVIAHRLSTILNADKIVVMQEGEIVETGKHEELLAKNGLYHKLYTMQFKD